MFIADILKECHTHNVKLSTLPGGHIRYVGPPEAITEEFINELRENKPALYMAVKLIELFDATFISGTVQ